MLSEKITYPFGKPPEGEDVLWRCEARSYAVCIDPELERYGSTPLRLEMYWFPVRKRTPKGAWIPGPWCGKRFVRLGETRKKYACNTEAEALESYIARKSRQISILSNRLKDAELGHSMAQNALNELSEARN